ncbi:MAG: hypothetical protein PHF25_00590 [Candidatus Margulisbacteria bacterium]|nr:hypothetical protein [Candidatus Margulisiibacteriota bacterium]
MLNDTMSKILFLSNGHGEDLISFRILTELQKILSDDSFYVLPMVGEGGAFSALTGINIIGPQKETSSGGFVKNILSLVKDLSSGILSLHFKQIKNASKIKYDLVVCVGDFLPFILSYLFLKYKKIVFISTAKSDFFEPHFWIERYFFKKSKTKVLARDSVTAENLVARGVNAEYFGNVMMDGFKIKRLPKTDQNQFIVGVLPGSRREAYINYSLIKEVILNLPDEWVYQVAVPNNLDKNKFQIEDKKDFIKMVKFENMLKEADIVLGLAGTANEQVIGFGIPLFTFRGYGPQTTRKRFLDQKKLLGNLPEFIDSQDSEVIAKLIKQKVKDRDFFERVRVDGIKVMGSSGAAERISKELAVLLKS